MVMSPTSSFSKFKASSSSQICKIRKICKLGSKGPDIVELKHVDFGLMKHWFVL